MEYTEDQKRSFREEFRARRRRQWIAALPFLLLVTALVLARASGDSLFGLAPRVWVPVALAVLAGAVIFSLRNWRCPACKGYLGRAFGPRFCARCGVALQWSRETFSPPEGRRVIATSGDGYIRSDGRRGARVGRLPRSPASLHAKGDQAER